MNTLVPQQWLELKPKTREALIKIFKIPRSSFTHVVDNKVQSDGHTYEDLKAVSLEEMKRLTNSSSDNFYEQFAIIIKMVEDDGSNVVAYPQPENSTQDGREHKEVSTPISGTVAAGVDTRAESRSVPQAPVSKAEALPVSGGINNVNRGRDELLPNSGDNNSAGVAAKNAKVDSQKLKVGGSVK